MTSKSRSAWLKVASFVLFGAFLSCMAYRPAHASEEVGTEEVTIDWKNYLSGRFASTHRDTHRAADHLNKAVEADPDNPELVRQAFSMSLASGRSEQAAALASKLATMEDQHTSLVDLVLSASALRNKEWENLEQTLVNANADGIINLIKPLARAWAAAEQGDVDAALDHLLVIKGSRSFDIFGSIHKAYILDYTGRTDEATAAYMDALIELQGADLQVARAYGNLLERLGKQSAAQMIYAEFLEQNPSDLTMSYALERARSGEVPEPFISSAAAGVAEAYYNTARRLARHRSRSPASIYLRLTLMLRPDFPIAQALLANLQDRERRYDAALASFTNLMDDPVFGWESQFERARLLIQLDREDEAVAILEAMHRDRPEDIGVLAGLADQMRNNEQYELATEYYDQVLSLIGEPKQRHWSLLYSRGISFERTGKWKKAEKDFFAALALQPDEPLVLNYLGYSWLEKGKNLDEALKMIEKAVEQRPEDGYIIDSLGWAHYQLKQYEESIDWLEKAIMLQPEDPTINDHLGDAYWRFGRKLEARFQWRHALVMKPEKEDVERIRAKIKNGLPKKHKRGE